MNKLPPNYHITLTLPKGYRMASSSSGVAVPATHRTSFALQFSCAKCDSQEAGVSYLADLDCLACVCRRCGFSWRQPCVDTKPEPAYLALPWEKCSVCDDRRPVAGWYSLGGAVSSFCSGCLQKMHEKAKPTPPAVKVEITFTCWRCKAALPALAAYRYYNLMLCKECCTLAARSTAY